MGAVTLRKDLSKPGLLNVLRRCFEGVADPKEGRRYSIADCLMSGLAVFLEKHPSLLAFGKSRADPVVRGNLVRLYGLYKEITDTTLRARLDGIQPGGGLRKAFHDVLKCAQRGGTLKLMRVWRKHCLVAVDATSSFSSGTIHGPCCLQRHHRSGSITYSHQQLCAVMVHPACRQVLPMAIEAIRNEAGAEKNDCETTAFARLVPALARTFRRMKLIIVADGLYSHAPQIRLLQEHGFPFLLVAKPGDHSHLYAQLEESGAPWMRDPSEDGRKADRWVRLTESLELNRSNPDLRINVLQSHEKSRGGGEKRMQCAWVTDMELAPEEVIEMACAARARWKIENETFNSLKT